jgi:hypothetical protein
MPLCYRPRVVHCVRHLTLLAALALPAAIVASCAGEMAGPRVCSERSPCHDGHTCVLGRCRVDGTMPVSLKASRMVFEPEDVGFFAGNEGTAKAALGSTIALGKRDRQELLLLRFALSLPEDARLQRALLVLEPFADCVRRPGRVQIELAQVLSPWQSFEVEHNKLPKLSVPMRAPNTSATPPRPLRIDVTEIVRAWREEPGRYHGLALLAAGESDTGACYATGVSLGEGPRLDVYLWPEDKKRGADAGSDADADAEDEDEDEDLTSDDKPDAGAEDGGA